MQRWFKRTTAITLSTFVALTHGAWMSTWAFTLNAGETLVVNSTPGNPYVIENTSGITINGLLRVIELDSIGGAATGNGGALHLLSSGGAINLGSTGSLNANAFLSGGNGGLILLNGNSLALNGSILANGLGAGRGGMIQLVGNSIDVQSLANFAARGGSTTSLGGAIDVNSAGIVTIANGAVLNAQGLTDATSNLITISGTGVNVDGLINANGVTGDDAGKIVVTGDTVAISGTGQLLADASTGAGGTITITGDTTVGGLVAASSIADNAGTITITGDTTIDGTVRTNTSADSKSGGTITVSGTSAQGLTLQNNGFISANGKSAGTDSTGGNVTATTGSITLGPGKITTHGSFTGDGQGGNVNLTATNTNITAQDGFELQNLAAKGGSTNLTASNGSIYVNSGSKILGQGDGTTTLNLTANHNITVGGLVEAGGFKDGDGGTLNVNIPMDALFNKEFELTGSGTISANGGPTSNGNGGNITVNAGTIYLGGGPTPADTTKISAYAGVSGAGEGDGGVITLNSLTFNANRSSVINAQGKTTETAGTYTKSVIDINTEYNASLDGVMQTGGRGVGASDGGLIDVESNHHMDIGPGAILRAGFGGGSHSGKGGQINLTTNIEDIEFIGGQDPNEGFLDVRSGANSTGGDITLTSNAGNIWVSQGDFRAQGSGFGGTVNFVAPEGLISMAKTITSTTGNASATQNQINFVGKTISNDLDGQLNANSLNSQGGKVNFSSATSLNLNAAAGINVNGQGDNDGSVNITAGRITTASAIDAGNGTLNITGTDDNLDVTIGKDLTAKEINVQTTGSGGSIDINSGVTLLSRLPNTDGGSITITADKNVNLKGTSALIASSLPARYGGKVAVTATNGTVTQDGGSKIETYGTRTLNLNKIDVSGETVMLEGTLNADGHYNYRKGGTINVTSTDGDLTTTTATLTAAGGSIDDGGLVTLSGTGGTLNIGAVDVSGGSGLSYHRRNGGNITIDATNGELNLKNTLNAAGAGNGDGGNITITSTGGNTTFENNASLQVNAAGIQGAGGQASINTDGFIIFSTGANVQAQGGFGGDIQLVANSSIALANNSYLHANSITTGRDGGSVSILSSAGDFTQIGNAEINTLGKSDAVQPQWWNASNNRVDITAKNISLGTIKAYGSNGSNGGVIRLSANPNNTFANSGKITLNQNLSVAGDHHGSGGVITMNAHGGDIIDNGFDISANGSGGGNGGQIQLYTNYESSKINLTGNTTAIGTNGGQIRASGFTGVTVTQDLLAYGTNGGNGGTVDVSSNTGNVLVQGINANGSNLNGASGNGGTISVGVDSFVGTGNITTAGVLEARGRNRGDGGNISVRNEVGAVTIHDAVHATSDNGQAGFISIDSVGDLTLNDSLNASAGSSGLGGRIDLNTYDRTSNSTDIYLNNGADLLAHGGTGGTIYIDADGGNFSDTQQISNLIQAHATNGSNQGGLVRVTNVNAFKLNDASDSITTYGQTDATHNTVSITAQDIDISGTVNANGLGGSEGGVINLNPEKLFYTYGGQFLVNGNGTGAGGTINLTSSAPSNILYKMVVTGGPGGSNSLFSARGGSSTQGGTVNVTSNSELELRAGTFDVRQQAQDAMGGTVNITTTDGYLNLGQDTQILTYGKTDANNNRVNLTAYDISVDGTIDARGNSYGVLGGEGGVINLTSTGRDIHIDTTGMLRTTGYTKTAGANGHGGKVTINSAGQYRQAGRIETFSTGNNVAALTNHGGDVEINAVTNADLLGTGNSWTLINTKGRDYAAGSNLNGGNAGDVTMTAADVNFEGFASVPRIAMQGGRGRGAGFTSGDGGALSITTTGTFTNSSANLPVNINVSGGASADGSTAGSDGTREHNNVAF